MSLTTTNFITNSIKLIYISYHTQIWWFKGDLDHSLSGSPSANMVGALSLRNEVREPSIRSLDFLLGIADLRVKSENDYHQSGYNNSPPPPTPLPAANYHDKPITTSPVPPKPSPEIWPAKMITSKSGGIATADGMLA